MTLTKCEKSFWDAQFALALDPDRAREYRNRAIAASHQKPQHGAKYCTMCGPDFCSMRISAELKQNCTGK